jgi:hypothetical protein
MWAIGTPWVSTWRLLGQLFIYLWYWPDTCMGIHLVATRPTIYLSMVLTWYLHAGNTPGYPAGGYSANYLSILCLWYWPDICMQVIPLGIHLVATRPTPPPATWHRATSPPTPPSIQVSIALSVQQLTLILISLNTQLCRAGHIFFKISGPLMLADFPLCEISGPKL